MDEESKLELQRLSEAGRSEVNAPGYHKSKWTKRILVTGGAGFIGANFVPYFMKRYPDYLVVVLDKLTYAGKREYLSECEHQTNFVFITGDICDQELVTRLFKQYDLTGVIHFAAESHVDNSIKGPEAFMQTNIMGTFNLLQEAYKHWMSSPGRVKSGYEAARFHHISTDEVYGSLNLGEDTFFSENTPYAPNSPYSASKASSDFLVRAYHHTYGLNVTTSNCSNNYGPKQHPEKLIPLVISCCLKEEPIPIYGTGSNVRDWLYVLDHCRAIDLIYHQGQTGETYNIGSNNEHSNLELVKALCAELDQMLPRALSSASSATSVTKDSSAKSASYTALITFVQDRAGHDQRYAIDASKIKKELGWQPEVDFSTGLKATIAWYLQQKKHQS